MENIRNWWSELHYTPLQKRSLAVVAALVISISAIFILRTSSTSEAIIPPEVVVETVEAKIIIDIQGAVQRPGVYHLPAQSRVFDAIRAAGGLTKKADPSDVNQARLLNDGEQIFIYSTATVSSSSSKAGSSRSRTAAFVLINRATAKEFEALDGIGPVLASRIVAFRKANGPFTTVDDLLKVPGIGSATLAKFKAKLRV